MMRLRTIWNPTMRGYTLRSRLHYTGEWFLRGVAHRLPRRLAYFSFIDSGARYMLPTEIVPEVRYTDILRRFSRKVDA
jgi:hypothetical protein